MNTRTLSEWLAWIEGVYPRTMELGLERVHAVLEQMDLRRPGFCAVTVAGTNGKGSTVAMLEACLRAAGYKVGAYTSPHLVRYNERVRLDGRAATDAELCDAFARVEAARGETPLTYFEFGTLAAFDLFRAAGTEVAALEVGLGGRLDAVNGIDADAAIVTSIGIDHTSWLGPDRESIGREKAGVFRAGRPAICGDPAPPASIAATAAAVGADLLLLDRDFFIERGRDGWTWRHGSRVRAGLPYPALRGDYQLRNAACAVTALELLSGRFPLSQAHIRAGLLNAAIAGRFQVLPGAPVRVLDVAHNPDAVRALAATLRQQPAGGKTLAVFGMLKDKDIAASARAMEGVVDRWYVATLHTPRGATADEIAAALARAGVTAPVLAHADVIGAYDAACRDADARDRVVVFGSFHTVGDILSSLGRGTVHGG
ncbi:MAG: bifunctional folylpolyglutamate synthase/dihydrofolate synthase [Candidatus Muproteobacteria bacterium RIFCSPHIGHO2_02_FULL_65_16]|uniref:Dihydrofolate synthase/folylpolyglutamate synthase n=1 Tax=Candidatus Muproteobacteria bacterium RIFCSPHIGHO2_02_FULL_65_16 TaxID=1817766 RepID=A0A1F6U6F6_9PROT|nr:MAG: bifunctional folylpolyglutamate synthase/dihydrofolate synthase [Candidatus Muproteobacteria bacterium RIFCSPHIGHO2_02_FULL_65_16]